MSTNLPMASSQHKTIQTKLCQAHSVFSFGLQSLGKSIAPLTLSLEKSKYLKSSVCALILLHAAHLQLINDASWWLSVRGTLICLFLVLTLFRHKDASYLAGVYVSYSVSVIIHCLTSFLSRLIRFVMKGFLA